MIYIRNGKRFNIYASQTIDSITYPDFCNAQVQANLGITMVEPPAPPADFSYDTYNVTEQDTDPYVVYTKKSAEQLAAQELAKNLAAARAYLAETDYKMLADYTVKPDGEPLDSIKAKRATAREFIRINEVEI